jgi:hypothetical protein
VRTLRTALSTYWHFVDSVNGVCPRQRNHGQKTKKHACSLPGRCGFLNTRTLTEASQCDRPDVSAKCHVWRTERERERRKLGGGSERHYRLEGGVIET